MLLTSLRHGQTVENRDKIIQGQLPGKLSEQGIEQVRAITKVLSTQSFQAIYSSDLGRCVETATIVHEALPNVPLQFTDALRELNFASAQGKHSSTLDWEALPGTILTKKISGGESWLDLYGRVSNWLEKTYRAYPSDRILVITHGGPIRVFRVILGHVPIQDIYAQPIANCETQEFEVDKSLLNFDLTFLND